MDVSFAKWSWGSDLSVEPWMNQPDHSHPTEMKVQTFSSDLPLTVHFLFPWAFPSQLFWGVALGQSLRVQLKFMVKLGPGAGTVTWPLRKV